MDNYDPFPSDDGDTTPADPTSGYEERAYVPTNKKKQRVQRQQDFRVDLGKTQTPDPVRHSYWGIILQAVAATDVPELYSVLRQDGAIVNVQMPPRLGDEQYRENTVILFVRDQGSETYFGVGPMEHADLNIYNAYITDSVFFEADTDLKFNTLGYLQNSQFTKDNDTGEITVTRGGIYELCLNITIEHQARYIEFTLTADMDAGSATADIDMFWDGFHPNDGLGTSMSPDPEITVYDTVGSSSAAPDGAKGIAIWDEKDGKYKIVECYGRLVLSGATCDDTATPDPDSESLTHLVAGPGLHVTQVQEDETDVPGKFMISVGIDIQNTDCFGDPVGDPVQVKEILELGNGLQIEDTGSEGNCKRKLKLHLPGLLSNSGTFVEDCDIPVRYEVYEDPAGCPQVRLFIKASDWPGSGDRTLEIIDDCFSADEFGDCGGA